jgi:hypothetical protein
VPGRSSPDAVRGHSRGVERHQARRRFGKGVASSRVDRRDDVEDVAIAEPGNLRFPAKNLIFSACGFPSPEPSPSPGVPVDQQCEQVPALLGLGVEPCARPRSTARAYSGKFRFVGRRRRALLRLCSSATGGPCLWPFEDDVGLVADGGGETHVPDTVPRSRGECAASRVPA